ncbi:MAG TPA: dTDP-4-dehydrorhamnose 3,5-epimerase [Rhodobacteraceae bacterium]|jgi:dTDP-4-dehydrorhamnose 3,5-epimerase|nr:dTDP-4-dehydrorhamnose 3,5-epimerase [Paracoccaceae bacterium]
MYIEGTKLTGVKLVKPKRFDDQRGFFVESYNRRVYSRLGIVADFVQENYSMSELAGTVRGLHFQAPPSAQDKLVRCGRGSIFDVAVDIRTGSSTYGQWVGYELSAENGAQLYIPSGFAHGFVTLEPKSEIIYKCSDYYNFKAEGSIRWNDPKLGIEWPVIDASIIKVKDARAPMLSELNSPFYFEE